MSATEHDGDCDGSWCDYCGCCEHGDDGHGCRAAEAPIGMECPGGGCGCEGESYYDAPVPHPDAPDEEPVDPASIQLHQETALFDVGSIA